ncbi:hypothetical protein BDW22DRAFT_1351712 [Trametopsis cervina]|nr:hypothetical protein BDW22DRAFT_1351712 [Trametopsis cervina]
MSYWWNGLSRRRGLRWRDSNRSIEIVEPYLSSPIDLLYAQILLHALTTATTTELLVYAGAVAAIQDDLVGIQRSKLPGVNVACFVRQIQPLSPANSGDLLRTTESFTQSSPSSSFTGLLDSGVMRLSVFFWSGLDYSGLPWAPLLEGILRAA